MRAKGKIAPLAAILLLIGLFVFWVDTLCFDPAFYKKEYAKLNTADTIGITEQGLSDATEALLDYLKDARDDLVVYADFGGEQREVFNAKEKQHMVDVRALYRTAKLVGYTSLGVGMLAFVWMFFKADKPLRLQVVQGYLRGNGIFFLLLTAIGLFAAIDFDTFWTMFHKLMFSNDLWLLDPRTDVLIMMVPQQFFFDLVMRIAIAAVLTIGGLLMGAWLWSRKLKQGIHDEFTDAK